MIREGAKKNKRRYAREKRATAPRRAYRGKSAIAKILKKLASKLSRFLLVPLSFLGYMTTLLIYALNRKKYIGLREIDPNEPVIVAFWHEYILMSAFHWKKLRKNKKSATVSAIISDHKDGEYITRLVMFLGIGAIRGSSTRGGVKAFIGALREIRMGGDIAFTPDGPRGPRRSVADGIILAARKSGAKILPLRYEATRYWRLESWDKFMVPKPFGTISFICDGLIDISGVNNRKAKQAIRAALNGENSEKA